MSKPNGISLGLGGDGLPRMFVTPRDRVSDKIWDAVQEAIAAGWNPDKFRREALDCWLQAIRDEAKAQTNEAVKVWTR